MFTRTLVLAFALLLVGAAPSLAQSRQPASVWRDVLGRGGVRVDDRDSDSDSDSDSDTDGGFYGYRNSDRDSDSDSDGGRWSSRQGGGVWDVWHPERPGGRDGRAGRGSGRPSIGDVILGRSIDRDLVRAHDTWHARNGAWSADARWQRAHDDLHRSLDSAMRQRTRQGSRYELPRLLSGLILGGGR